MGKAKKRRGRGGSGNVVSAARPDADAYAHAKLQGNNAIADGDLRAAINYYTQPVVISLFAHVQFTVVRARPWWTGFACTTDRALRFP